MMTTMNDAEREAFRAAHRELDLSEKPDALGRPQFLHSHVEVTWRGFQAGAAWQRAQGAVPDGFMPIPTAEQLAEALENVRSFHDMSAELIAPELLTNLLAALAASTGQEVEK